MGRTQQHHTKAVVVVAVVRLIPVAVGTTSVVLIVVPRTAPHDLSRPPDWILLTSGLSIAEKKSSSRYAACGGSLPHTPSEAEPSETQSSEQQRAELKKQGQNTTTPHESRRSCRGRQVDPRGRHNERSLERCPKNRPARPDKCRPQTASLPASGR